MLFQRLAAPLSAAALILSPVPSRAQEPAPAAPPPPAEAESPCCVVPARTPIEIELLDTVNSKANRTGQNFAFRLAAPLAVDGQIVVPAGTPGVGEIVHAERARFGGRAGELILAARYLDYQGSRIQLRTLRFGRQHGRDSSGTINNVNLALAATVPALSLIGYMIAGGEVNVPAGTLGSAQIAAETRLSPIETNMGGEGE